MSKLRREFGVEAILRKTESFPEPGGGRRLRLRGDRGACSHYHVMSRTAGGEVFWDDVEKQALVAVLWRMARFCGIEILTYCVMGNHFHALVRVPDREEWLRRFDGPGGEEELLRHLGCHYGRRYLAILRYELEARAARGDDEGRRLLLAAYTRRMCDVTFWAKEVKERFSRWFNRRHSRKGTLWMERFRSILVEDGAALGAMAAYIDLNPVRAGLVEEPGSYPWSGCGAARRGERRAVAGIQQLGMGEGSYAGWLHSLSAGDGRGPGRGVGGRSLASDRLRCFSRGLAVGSRAWVEGVFARQRVGFGPKRRSGARRIRGLEGEFYALRDLDRNDMRSG